MAEQIINEKVKSYLIACLVTGIDVESKPDVLMAELVDHMNSAERHFWAEGDEDGVIVHNKHDVPVMYIMYNGKRMTFRAFEEDDYTAMINRSDMGYALLNIVGLLQSKDLAFQPSIMGSELHVVEHLTKESSKDTKPEDWAL